MDETLQQALRTVGAACFQTVYVRGGSAVAPKKPGGIPLPLVAEAQIKALVGLGLMEEAGSWVSRGPFDGRRRYTHQLCRRYTLTEAGRARLEELGA